MSVLTIGHSNGKSSVDLFYQDSGAPERPAYTTVVVLHGIYFHSAAFQHVIPLATCQGFRMVCLNRRDYPGTTKYGPEELKVLAEGDPDQHAAFLRSRGEELAEFLYHLIDALSLPEPTPDGKEGGLALMGWSMSSIYSLSTIGSVSFLQPRVRKRLQSYLRKLILFDPPSQALGIPGKDPELAETASQQDNWVRFAQWIACYFTHGDLSTHDVTKIEYVTPDLTKKSIAASLSLQQMSSITDHEAAGRSDIFLIRSPSVLLDQTHNALFNSETRALWPHMDVWFLHCDSSAGMMVHAAGELRKLAKANEDLPVKFFTIKDAHHLVFWDDPEKAVKAFGHCLEN